jgi:hypothetical protein
MGKERMGEGRGGVSESDGVSRGGREVLRAPREAGGGARLRAIVHVQRARPSRDWGSQRAADAHDTPKAGGIQRSAHAASEGDGQGPFAP